MKVDKLSLSITELCIRVADAVAASSHQGPILFNKCFFQVVLVMDIFYWTMLMGTETEAATKKFPKTMFCHLGPLLSRLADILPGVPAELHLVA